MSAEEIPPSDLEPTSGDRRFLIPRRGSSAPTRGNPVINLRPGEVPADLPSAAFVRGYEIIDDELRRDEISDAEIRKWVGGRPKR